MNGHANAGLERLEIDAETSAKESSDTEDRWDDTVTMGFSPRKPDPKIWGDIESMSVISKSPYEVNESAEVGEPVFDDMKMLLFRDDESDNGLCPEATRLFGTCLANSLVDAHDQIGKSGMVFNPVWQEGKIRGVQCGWIPKALLLLCLHEQRFTKTNHAVLQGLIKDLGVTKIVGDALKEWGMETEFKELATNAQYMYTGRKLTCYKCEIFVARAYRSIKALKRKTLEASTMSKVRSCLAIMSEHVKVNKRRLAELEEQARRKSQKLEKKEQAKRQQEMHAAAAAKKFLAATTIKSEVAVASLDENDVRKRKRVERAKSLKVLLNMFEEQHNRMGETLKVLRQKIQDNYEADAQDLRNEIRAEIMQELATKMKNGSHKRHKK